MSCRARDEDVREESGVSRGENCARSASAIQRGAECDARERGDDARTGMGPPRTTRSRGRVTSGMTPPRDDDGALRRWRFASMRVQSAALNASARGTRERPPAPGSPGSSGAGASTRTTPRARRLKREYRGPARHPFRRLGAEQRSQHAQRAVRQRRSAGARPHPHARGLMPKRHATVSGEPEPRQHRFSSVVCVEKESCVGPLSRSVE